MTRYKEFLGKLLVLSVAATFVAMGCDSAGGIESSSRQGAIPIHANVDVSQIEIERLANGGESPFSDQSDDSESSLTPRQQQSLERLEEAKDRLLAPDFQMEVPPEVLAKMQEEQGPGQLDDDAVEQVEEEIEALEEMSEAPDPASARQTRNLFKLALKEERESENEFYSLAAGPVEEQITTSLLSERQELWPEPEAYDATACDAGYTIGHGTAGNDSHAGIGDKTCIVGYEGNDTLYQADYWPFWPFWVVHPTNGILVGGPGDDDLIASINGGPHRFAGGDGADAIFGSNSSDQAYAGNGDDELYGRGGDDFFDGGLGNDNLVGEDGDDELIGGPGSDELWGGHGHDLLVPGEGVDNAQGEWGDDTFIIHDFCELREGGTISGGDGTDTLVAPFTVEELAAGFDISSVEVSEVDESLRGDSACSACDCKPVDGEIVCCNGHGTCIGDPTDGPVGCDCDDGQGYVGIACDHKPHEAVFEPIVDVLCPVEDPSCWKEFPAMDLKANIPAALPDQIPENGLCGDLLAAIEEAYGDDGSGDGTLEAHVFAPVNDDRDMSVVRDGQHPLVMFIHGAGHNYGNYVSPFTHLANQGHIVVSLKLTKGDSLAPYPRAQIGICALRALKAGLFTSTEVPGLDEHIDWSSVAVMGHSRGGEAAILAANYVHWSANEVNDPRDQGIGIRSVVSIMPSNACEKPDSDGAPIEDCSAPRYLGDLDGEQVQSFAAIRDGAFPEFYLLAGTMDGDVPRQGIPKFELAGVEDPDGLSNSLLKSMHWIHYFPHNSWGGSFNARDDSVAVHIFKGLVGGFLNWRLLGRWDHGRYFRSSELPPCLVSPEDCGLTELKPDAYSSEFLPRVEPVVAQWQFSEGTEDGGKRIVVADIQEAFDLNMPGYLEFSPAGSGIAVTTGGLYRHLRSNAVLLTGSPTASLKAAFESPFSVLGNNVDYLSFRIARVVEPVPDPSESPCEPLDASNLSYSVALKGNFGERVFEGESLTVVPPAHHNLGAAYHGTSYRIANMCNAAPVFQTVRLPLGNLSFTQAPNITEIEISFDGRDADDPANDPVPNERVLIDSIEFTRDPDLCGNGQIEESLGEDCDGSNLNGQSCHSLLHSNGPLGCSATCHFDVSACINPGAGSSGPSNGEECDERSDYPGAGDWSKIFEKRTYLKNTEAGAMFFRYCAEEDGSTCVWTGKGRVGSKKFKPDAFECKNCPGEPGCYCEDDDQCVAELGPGAKCYGPGLVGAEYGCFRPSDLPDFACQEACHDDRRVCGYWPGAGLASGVCYSPYCLGNISEPDNWACEMRGEVCNEDTEVCEAP